MLIPHNVRRLMWEYDDEGLDATENLPDSVLERLMLRGGAAEMRWLLGSVSRSRLRSYLEGRGCRVLPPRELRFWCRKAGIEETTATEWVRKANVRESSWR